MAEQFPQFDVVSDVADHHFAGRKADKISGPLQKKITQEWKLLSKDLPDSIFVRVYETRVDLLRAAIVGARGTPYHDGLFFFDIALPSDYPNSPPKVYYWCFGFRVNPNLYNNGHVCLSLLNTWYGSGKKGEKWDPKNSTLFQVLLSIQALILNEKPYFNEPASATLTRKKHWEKKSLGYNEDVFVLSCKTMRLLLEKPPSHFESLVNQHFKDRAEFILGACDMYRKGLVKVGLFDGIIREGRGEVSSNFKAALDQVYANLVGAFAKTGAPIEHFVEQARDEQENKAKEKAVADAVAAATAGKKGKNIASEVGNNVVMNLRKMFEGLLMKNKEKSKTSPLLDVPQGA